jgi:hypothetical protein
MKFSTQTAIVNAPAGKNRMLIAGVGAPRVSSNGANVCTITFKDNLDRLAFYYVNLDPIESSVDDAGEEKASLPVNLIIFLRSIGGQIDLEGLAAAYAVSPEHYREFIADSLREYAGTEVMATVETYAGGTRASVKSFTTSLKTLADLAADADLESVADVI